jgi:hypothetical protein
MATASSLVYQLGPRAWTVVAQAAVVWSVLALLAFVASWLDPAIPGPSPDRLRSAPFRWRDLPDGLA